MKGFIIYEDYRGKKVVEAVKLGAVNYATSSSDGDWVSELCGIRKGATQAYCNKDDTYDFETGALIALMKMCGREKVIKACDELYKDDNYKNALQEMTENNEKLIEEIKRLKTEKHMVIAAKNVLYSKLEKENETLKEEIERLKIKNKYFIEDINRKFEYITEFKRSNDVLKEENEKLKLDLVELFKKLDKKKLDAAYNKWRQQWIKPPTKREHKWERILESHKKSNVIIVVKREDVNSFLHEIENRIPEITWASGIKIFESKGIIKDIYEALKTCGRIYFRLQKSNKLSYSTNPDIYLCTDEVRFEHISYLPPMRWDLFKKGRIVIGVKNNNELEEFRKEVERNTGIKDIPMCPTNLCLFYSFDKDNYKIILESVEEPNIAKINGHKVYYWEDVR